MQGRHKKMENFTDIITSPAPPIADMPKHCPYLMAINGNSRTARIYFSREGVDQFKTHFYTVEGWDPNTGYPRAKLLNSWACPK